MNRLHCIHCKHSWLPKDPNRVPVVCPRCKSYTWQGKEIDSEIDQAIEDRDHHHGDRR